MTKTKIKRDIRFGVAYTSPARRNFDIYVYGSCCSETPNHTYDCVLNNSLHGFGYLGILGWTKFDMD